LGLIMITIDIPGFRELRLTELVLDYNGTLAVDGRLLPGVADRLRAVAAQLRIHVLTADTFGRAAAELAGLPAQLTIAPPENQAEVKRAFVERLGATQVVAIGNGRNDRLMVQTAALGIALMQAEGAAVETVTSATVLSANIGDALDLLLNPQRLVATLRS